MQIGGGVKWFCDKSTKIKGHGTDGSVTDGEGGLKNNFMFIFMFMAVIFFRMAKKCKY